MFVAARKAVSLAAKRIDPPRIDPRYRENRPMAIALRASISASGMGVS